MSWFTANPALGSAIIGAGGDIVSSLLNNSGGAPKSAYREAASSTMEAKIRTARREGIHPLYALGTSVPAPIQQAGQGDSKLASAIRQGAKKFSDYPLMKQEIERSKAAARLDDANAALVAAQTAQLENVGTSNKDGSVAKTTPAETIQKPVPTHIKAWNPITENYQWVPNPDVFETGEVPGGIEYTRGLKAGDKTAKQKREAALRARTGARKARRRAYQRSRQR